MKCFNKIRRVSKMGFMSLWESWSKKLWETKGSKLQAQADAINGWKLPDWVKEIIHRLDKVLLSTAALAFLKKFALEVAKRFDDEMAKKLVESVVGILMESEE